MSCQFTVCRWLIGLLLSVTFASITASCDTTHSELPSVTAKFIRPDGSETATFELEVASNEVERRKGLMFRREMAERHGMIFLFPTERINSFWMKNTILSLDMLFVDADWRVVGVLSRVPPQNEAPRAVSAPSQFVIELGAGIADKFQISDGAKVVIAGELPAARE